MSTQPTDLEKMIADYFAAKGMAITPVAKPKRKPPVKRVVEPEPILLLEPKARIKLKLQRNAQQRRRLQAALKARQRVNWWAMACVICIALTTIISIGANAQP